MNRRQFIKSAGALLAALLLGPIKAQAKKDGPGQHKQRHCRPHCVVLELQGRQNEPPVIYEVCQ